MVSHLLRGQTPTPSPSAGNHPTTSTLDIALVGAVIGGVATVLAELIARLIGNYRSYRFILSILREEVAEIVKQVNRRESHLDVMIPLYEPFPTRAWETLIQSQQRRYMTKKRRSALSSLYWAVSVANAHASLIPAALQISQLAISQEVRNRYRDETIRLLKQPLAAIEAALPEAGNAIKLTDIAESPAAISDGAA
jgi:hypothetical protein